MTAGSREIVSLESVTKDFRSGFGLRAKRVLDGISLGLREGEIFGFVGPNGAGKTTTIKILMGLIHPTKGYARVLGHDVRESAFRRYIGYLPENPCFYEFLTGREFLRFYGALCGMDRRACDRRIAELFEWVHLEHAGEERLRAYSKGMLQRIGIAQALINDPKVVFLDEPMSGLDPIGRKEIRDLIHRLGVEGKTVFMNSHILPDVELLCNRVAIIVQGKIRYQGSVEEFLATNGRENDVVVGKLPPDIAAKIEESFGVTLRGMGEKVEVRIPEKRTSELLTLLLAAEADVISVTPHRVSLEQIFLSAVREGNS